MRVSISNIAWEASEERKVARVLSALGLDRMEIAPGKRWQKPLEAKPSEIAAYRAQWAEDGLELYSMQAVLFGRPELLIFGEPGVRKQTQQYLEGIITLAARLGVQRIVFGSPANRKAGALPKDEAFAIAAEFFGALGRASEEEGLVFCIEPNPPAYGCDFVTSSDDGAKLVSMVGSKGFGLHLDAAGMFLNGEDVAASIRTHAAQLCHFHLSAPNLTPVLRGEKIDYALVGRTLEEVGYRGDVVIEMRGGPEGTNIPRVSESLGFVLAQMPPAFVAARDA